MLPTHVVAHTVVFLMREQEVSTDCGKLERSDTGDLYVPTRIKLVWQLVFRRCRYYTTEM